MQLSGRELHYNTSTSKGCFVLLWALLGPQAAMVSIDWMFLGPLEAIKQSFFSLAAFLEGKFWHTKYKTSYHVMTSLLFK